VIPAALTAAAIAGCPLFGPSFTTNQRVDHLPVAADSAAIVRSIGLDDHVHADFGSGLWEDSPIGIPVTVVNRHTKRAKVRFDYADESDRVRYPIPPKVKIEGESKLSRASSLREHRGGGDRHALLVDRSKCRLYELYALRRSGGGWAAGSGATWNLRHFKARTRGWTSADAAGLPIAPLLARPGTGRIRHALRVTVSQTRRAFVWPARHFAADSNDPSLPRMGERIRLRNSVDISHFPKQARRVAQAMKTYGLIVADNGSDWFISGVPSRRWNNDQLHGLDVLSGSDFEVVDASG
jgi:hypothetical protein